MKRKTDSKQGLASDARAWLRGGDSGFFMFRPDDELEALWREHGDDGTMFWRPNMAQPISRQALTANENAWLASGTDDLYGANSHFIAKYYTNDDKRSLWSKRGDHESFLWESGMRRPVSIVVPA